MDDPVVVRRLRDEIGTVTDLVNALRAVRKQLTLRNELLEDVPRTNSLREQSKGLLARLDTLERKLHNPGAEVSPGGERRNGARDCAKEHH